MDDAADTGSTPGWLGSGALAGVVSAVGFAWIHDLLISDIWEMIGVMGVAAAITGVALVWTYDRMTPQPSRSHWVIYIGTYIVLFAVLPALSMLLFDPVTTFAEAAASEGPLDELIVEALPFTIIAVFVIAAVVVAAFGSLGRDLLPVLLAVTLLMTFLGLNLTMIGLVEFTGTQVRVIAGFIGLIGLIGGVFAVTFGLLQWRALGRPGSEEDRR